MRSSCLRVGRTGALSEEVVRSRSFGGRIGVVAESVMVVLTFVRVGLETRTELKIRLGKQRTWGLRAGKFR